MELASNATRDNKKRGVMTQHIPLVMADNEELNQLLKGVTIASGEMGAAQYPS